MSPALERVAAAVDFPADLAVDGMLHAALVRCPHAHAALLHVDAAAALLLDGVLDVVTAADVPGALGYGPERGDRPVLASGVCRHVGEPVAAVLAVDPATARRAAAAVGVTYRVLAPVTDVEHADAAHPVHPDGAVIRALRVRRGEPAGADAEALGPDVDWAAPPVPAPGATVVVEGEYVIAPRLAAPPAPAAALALPVRGGLDLVTASAWPEGDRDQIAQCLNLTPPQLRLLAAAAAGPPPEELTVAVLACLLAGRSGRPVRLVDVAAAPRERAAGPAARLRYRHHADADGRIVAVQARIRLDAGAYAGVASATLAHLCAAGVGPYQAPAVDLDAVAVRTTNPPAPDLRGGGAALACVAVEAQLDRLAARLGLDPLALRELNRLDDADPLPTGQLVAGGSPAPELLAAVAALPLPRRRRSAAGGLRRGVGHAAGITPLLPGEGADHGATATVRYAGGAATVWCAAPELGQGFDAVAARAVREALGTEQVDVRPADGQQPSAGPAARSRLAWVAGGAVHAAARGIADELCAEIGAAQGVSASLLTAAGGRIRSYDGVLDVALSDVAAGRVLERAATFAPPRTEPLDAAGQGRAFAGFGFAAHRAVVDVDPELGLVHLVELAVAADVGRVVDLPGLLACLDGAGAAGVGMALLEDAAAPGPYLLASADDVAAARVALLLETGQEGSWLGMKGTWDSAVGAAAAAVLAAVRDATGLDVSSVPVRPWDLLDLAHDGVAAR